MRNFIFSLLALILIPAYMSGQEIKGKLQDEKGIPIPGANIVSMESKASATSDFDGNFSIKAKENETLEFSFIGYESTTKKATSNMKVVLKESETALKEVVVIGYGTAKKIDLTSSISTIKSEDLQKTPAGQVVQGVQGKVAGVQISSSGSPGDSPEINIRGLHSLYGNSTPLYVVDGIFVDSIDFLNSSDIQDFTILKDASASAIYGVRAANGVILITTKGGKFNRKARITYTGYNGVQRANNVLKMANAEQFTNFALESGSASEIASIQAAIQRYGRSRTNPNLPDVNTDWYKEVLRQASIQSHDLSVEGGTDDVAYAVGGNFFTQEGILKMKNSYERFNIRAKVDIKAKDWLKVGANLIYSKSTKYDDEASAWQQVYFAVPILPVYDSSYTDASPSPYADAQAIGYRDHQNPFSLLDNSNKKGDRRRTIANVYADFSILPQKLNFKTSLSYNTRSDNERIVLLPYFANSSYQRTTSQSSIERNNLVYENYIFDNTLTYTQKFGEHDFTALGGFSFRDDSYLKTNIKGFFVNGGPFVRDNEQTWYLQNTDPTTKTSSDEGTRFYGSSYFGRLSYKYKDRYIAYATIRNEGSNKYDQKYVTLPAVGLGWIVSEESFLKGIKNLDLLKFRAGWGRLANDAVPNSRRQSAVTASTVFDNHLLTGYNFSTFSDELSWEYTEESNFGLSAEFFKNRLSIEADYFIKDTKDLAIPVNPQVGNEVSYRNVGSLRNKGFEFTATWKGKINENFGYNISGNFSKIKNEVTSLNGQPFIDRGVAEFRQRLTVGQSIDEFLGWDIVGVYQTQAEVNADPVAIAANKGGVGTVKPGYFKYRDVDGNGVLDANDRVFLGSPVPTFYYGGSIGLNYKNWDFSAAFYGQGGNVILNRNRAEVIRTQGRNIDADLAINRWHGEGTSNDMPSSEGYRQSWNQKNSKFFLAEGDFLRVQNIQLGYNLKEVKLAEMRFTLTVDRPFLWTKASNGFNPEVGFDGVDIDTYPTPSVFTLGYSVKF